mgnify:CR=1 FL=1
MNSYLDHVQINIAKSNLSFYRELMTFLGWKVLVDVFESEGVIGFGTEKNGSIWLVAGKREDQMNRDSIGYNHIGIKVEIQKNVDEATDFLKKKNTELLFGTPRHRPEFAESESNTYYQVMFESPDKILFEIVYTGTKM